MKQLHHDFILLFSLIFYKIRFIRIIFTLSHRSRQFFINFPFLVFTSPHSNPFIGNTKVKFSPGVAIFLCYFNQLTFFAGCLVLHARRVHESRHCVTCVKTSSRVELRRKGMNEAYVLLCSGHPSSARHGEAETFCQKVPGASSLPKLLLTRNAKFFLLRNSNDNKSSLKMPNEQPNARVKVLYKIRLGFFIISSILNFKFYYK